MFQAEFIIDKITNSIEDRITGESFQTILKPVTKEDLKIITKKNGWSFSWKKEYNEENRQIYKLLIVENPQIHGLISFEPLKSEQFIELHLIENAPHNFGANKQFLGVAANMVAFACKTSFELGFEGFVAFTAKTKLVKHYIETLGARLLFGNSRMGIFTEEAKILVNSYYKNEHYE
jgi:hypothetical protein